MQDATYDAPLTSTEVQSLRTKIANGEGTLEEAMRAMRAIRASFEVRSASEPKAKASKEPPKPTEDFF